MIRILIAIALLGLPSQAPSRDRPRDARGVHSIQGLVVDAQNSMPVRRAQVVATTAGGERVATVSDAQGRFVLRELTAGRHTLSVNKPGYLQGSYEQIRPGGPGIAIDVPGEVADSDLKLTIFRGGVIPGRVVDERGDPVPLAQVRALQYQYDHGSRRLVAAQGSTPPLLTDDLGGFRLYGLAPGRYVVVTSGGAMPSPILPMPATTAIRLPLMTYFPNTPDAANAQPMSVSAGKETAAITITLASGRTVRVRGRVMRSTGEPFTGGVSAAPLEGYSVVMTSGAAVRPDGSFELMRILPGSYLLTARDRSTAIPNPEGGYAVVTVGGDDVENVSIVTGKPGVARGRVIADDGSAIPRAQLMVNTERASEANRVWSSNGASRVRDDGTFELDGLIGAHAFQLDTDGKREWSLASAWRSDQEITDTGLIFGPDDLIENITLVITRNRNELSGSIVDASGTQTSDGLVIVFPADSSLWNSSRWVRATQVDRRGHFRFEGLPPSDQFLVVSVPYSAIDGDEWRNPDTLHELRPWAASITLGPSEKKVVNLRLASK